MNEYSLDAETLGKLFRYIEDRSPSHEWPFSPAKNGGVIGKSFEVDAGFTNRRPLSRGYKLIKLKITDTLEKVEVEGRARWKPATGLIIRDSTRNLYESELSLIEECYLTAWLISSMVHRTRYSFSADVEVVFAGFPVGANPDANNPVDIAHERNIKFSRRNLVRTLFLGLFGTSYEVRN